MSDETTLVGVVDRVSFSNEETGFAVLKIALEDRVQPATAVGPLSGAQPGETVRMVGRWQHDRKFGEQFKAESYVPVQPANLVGIKKFLGSGLVEGIGPVMAERLVAKFGLQTLDVIDNEPHRITEVEGIGPKRRERILGAWNAMRAVREVMVFLQSHRVTTAHAARIYRAYGTNAIAIVRANPYRLAREVRGIGFATADSIAEALGIAKDSPERAEAGTYHVLTEAAGDGHVYVPRLELIEKTTELLGTSTMHCEGAVDRLAQHGQVVVEDHDVFTPPLHEAETRLAERFGNIIDAPMNPIEIDVEKALEWLEQQQGIRLAPEQREAVSAATREKILVITGGPGTGKTTVVNSVIRVLEKKHRKIVLCAPTGRAAKRMFEATGREAKTIHRLLEFSPKDSAFQKTEEEPIEADIIIVDEVSMVDTKLMRSLLEAVPDHAQLILVGDIDQLPSVGAGNVLKDVIRSRATRVVTLAHIFRQAEESLIVTNAHRVNGGTIPTSAGDPTGDFFFIEKEEPEDVVRTIKTLVHERIPRRFGLDSVDDIQVLTPMHRGVLGASNLNVELQATLNPRGDRVVRGSKTYRIGDKVMQLRNDYDRDVFNGDVGRVHRINEDDRTIDVLFEGRPVTYPFAELDALVLAYACSIHKSQGSEYPAVVIPVHTQHYVMLRRNLLYTAITRGKRLVVLVGTTKALRLCVSNNRLQPRFTKLSERLQATR